MNTWWVIERKEGTLDVFLPHEDLTRESSRNGINPDTVRTTLLSAFDGGPVLFQLVTGDGAIDADHSARPTDLLFWSWVPIFSDRARKLILELGGDQSDFVPCVFASTGGEVFFLHLPGRSLDVLDLATSQFTMMIPMQPPLPHGIKVLGMRNTQAVLPPCFRMSVPGHSQVFSELIVSDALHAAWDAAGLSGAAFRKVA